MWGRRCRLALVFVFSFPGLQGAVQKMTIIIIIIILIIIILIIVTCIHSIFVVRQQEQIPPTCYNKGPDSTDEQRVYMSAFRKVIRMTSEGDL